MSKKVNLSKSQSIIAMNSNVLVELNPTETDKNLIINHQIEEISIGVVGDIMFHNTQLYRAYRSDKKSFDFSDIFKYVEPFLKDNDLTFGNLETTLYGPFGSETSVDEFNYYGYSGYPNFNSPDSVLLPIKKAGFDFLATGNNHCLDRTYNGMIRTIEKLDNIDMAHTGTFLSSEERKPYELISTKGITFAVVNYTYATNGINLNKEQMQLVNTMNLYEEEALERLYQDVELAEQSEADYVICMLHYGNEYWPLEDERYQKPVTYEVIKRGADIVFGGHPHVLEPIDILYELDGITFDEPKIIIYSLGNFLASQPFGTHNSANTDFGVLFNLYFETIDNGKPRIKGMGFLPTYTIWQSNLITPIPIIKDKSKLEANTIDLDELHYSEKDKNRISFGEDYIINHLMQYVIGKGLLGGVYNDNGIYRFDLLTKENGM